MRARGDWYFDGYEARTSIGPDGRAHKELIYTGEYYGFARGQDPMPIKLVCTAATLIYLICYVLDAMSGAAIARVPYIGLPLMLSLAPGAYLLIGLGCFLPAEREMTVRVCYSSLRRMDRALRIMLPLVCVSLIGCIVYAFLSPALLTARKELSYLLCAAAASLAVIFEFIYLRKNPVIVVRDPEPESERVRELEEKRKRSEDRKARRNKGC